MLASVLLLWPSLLNHFPLLYPDSINYLGDGPQIAHALLHPGALGWMRSPVYSLGIFLLHWARNPWPVVALHALITAWVLWLVVRSVLERSLVAGYLTLIAVLSVLTGLSWVVSWVLPDILGAILYLCVYLLVFVRDSLNRTEAVIVACLFVWSANSHVTHLSLALFVCAWLGFLLLVRPGFMRSRARAVLDLAALTAIALVLQVAVNGYLTGSWTLTGKHPPFLTARLLGDGPARTLLQQRCGDLHFTLCSFKDSLPTDSDEFLWGQGIMTQATPAQAAQLSREEMPLLAATLRAYPWQQARISLNNFRTQLTDYDIEGFGNNTWAEHTLPQVMPAAIGPYHRSLQFQNQVPSDPFSAIQARVIPLSVLALLLALPVCWRRRHLRLLALSGILLPLIAANAFLTGVLSVADSRYQVRVIWLLPFLAGLILLQLIADRRRAASPA